MSMKLYRYILFQVFNKIYDLLSRNYLITYSLYQKCLYDVRLISKPHIFIWEKKIWSGRHIFPQKSDWGMQRFN